MSLFITGTDTGVGKTYIAVRLLHLLRACGVRCAGIKPICCGDRRDAEALLAAGSDGLNIDDVNPVWLKTPAAPIVGSLLEKVAIDVDRILAAFSVLQGDVEYVIVEGTGGWMVPLRSNYFVGDLASRNEVTSSRRGAEPLRLPQSRVAHFAEHCSAPAVMRRRRIEQRRGPVGYCGVYQRRYFGAYSGCSAALWTRRKPYGTA
ncbi:MAG TPA: dethiobiotin synthase [Candidatus Udaeobacter sp.]|nr:dethiobiotin synthase [Candidatus Udaeobacter sp.]